MIRRTALDPVDTVHTQRRINHGADGARARGPPAAEGPPDKKHIFLHNVNVVSVDTFPGEMVQFVAFAKEKTAAQAKLLSEDGLTDTFPNVHVALHYCASW